MNLEAPNFSLIMNKAKNISNNLFHYLLEIDVVFLIFLLLITNVSLVLKLLGVVFIFALRFRPKIKLQNLPLFYPFILILIAIQLIVYFTTLSPNYLILACFGMFMWTLSTLILIQIKNGINLAGSHRIHNTIVLFFIINALFSVFNIVSIMFKIQNINPYNAPGMDLYYGMSTGDHIFGVFKDTSTTNSCINVLGFVYFLFQRKIWLSLICLMVVLITTSNINIAILVLSFLIIFISWSSKLLKTLIVCCVGLITIFFVKVSPNNLKYFANKLHLQYDIPPPPSNTGFEIAANNEENSEPLTEADVKSLEIFKEIYTQKRALEKEKEQKKYIIDSVFIKQQLSVSSRLISFSKKVYGDSVECDSKNCENRLAGKLLSFQETIHYCGSNIWRFIVGGGVGRFSSKLAFKASGVGVFGNYPLKYQYISDDFKNNHLQILTFYFLQSPDKHSATNTPYSVFNQLLGEYGIIGLLLFLVFYVFYFLKRFSILSYGRILLPIMLFFLFTDYWFENISVVAIFELLMMLDLNKKPELNGEKAS